VLSDAPGGKPAVILISSGSEVELIVEAQQKLAADGIAARVVSMPCMEFFARQPTAYRDTVLPPTVGARLAVEAAIAQPWYRWVGTQGSVLSIEHFGASAPYQRLYQEFGLTVEAIVQRAKDLVKPGARG
jgi:transketolase